jgi:hypothetical protein
MALQHLVDGAVFMSLAAARHDTYVSADGHAADTSLTMLVTIMSPMTQAASSVATELWLWAYNNFPISLTPLSSLSNKID